MSFRDDDLTRLAVDGMPDLPAADNAGFVDTNGARIWYAQFGSGPAVVLLHGGLGNAGNWAYQVPALRTAGFGVIAIDSRGHGRSTRDHQPFSYRLMASDVRAVMDSLAVAKAAIVGWSDGADTGLVLAETSPDRVAGLFFFACNVDASGTKPFEFTPIVERIFNRHKQDHARLSATPDAFESLSEAVGLMQRTQPEYSAAELTRIDVPVTVAIGEHDEFIERKHMEYLANTLPRAKLVVLDEVSHFAPLQRPELFTAAVQAFLRDLAGWAGSGGSAAR